MASCLLLSLWEDGWEELEGAELGVLEEPGLVLVQPASRSPETVSYTHLTLPTNSRV